MENIITEHTIKFENDNYTIKVEDNNDDNYNLLATIYAENNCTEGGNIYIGKASFWYVHDRYDINVIDGGDLIFNIIETLCEKVASGEIQEL